MEAERRAAAEKAAAERKTLIETRRATSVEESGENTRRRTKNEANAMRNKAMTDEERAIREKKEAKWKQRRADKLIEV